jgi:hypothetical protein
VFFTAQAVGFTGKSLLPSAGAAAAAAVTNDGASGRAGEMAYWISAFAQAVDFVQFMPVDSCGEVLERRLWTPPMRGFLRTSTYTGAHTAQFINFQSRI